MLASAFVNLLQSSLQSVLLFLGQYQKTLRFLMEWLDSVRFRSNTKQQKYQLSDVLIEHLKLIHFFPL